MGLKLIAIYCLTGILLLVKRSQIIKMPIKSFNGETISLELLGC